MRKFFVLVLLVALIAPMFADDAKVMPKGVLRTTLGYVNNSFDKEYDKDGESDDTTEVKMNILGAALEMGITEQITAAAQWVPGYTFDSEIEGNDKAKINGFHDIFLGAKVQILGDHGFVKNDKMRLAAALGAVIPLNDYDGKEAYDNFVAGDEFAYETPSNEAFGIGARLYYDILITPDFYVNFYSQFIKYFDNEISSLSPTGAEVEYSFKYSLDLEIEPNYTFKFNEGNKLSIAAPLQFAYTPEYDVNGVTQDDEDTSLLSFAPSISMFTTALVIPMDLKVQYSIPVYGVNAKASNSLAILLKLYTRLF